MLKKFFLISAILPAVFLGCENTDDQRDFEREAFQPPEGITITNEQGQIQSEDADDWRIAPEFQGFVEVNPSFPNPVDVSSNFTIELTVTGVQGIAGLEIIVVFNENNFNTIFIEDESPLRTGLTAVQLSAVQLGQFTDIESARGIHRVVIAELNSGRIISYGDIQVE